MAEVVVVEDVHVRFGKREVLTAYNLAMSDGESVAITGPSGAGKSTLLACVWE